MAAAGSLLESFFILFQSDSAEVQEGAERAEKGSKKLEKKLQDVQKQSKKAGDDFASLAKKAVNVLLPFVGLNAMKGVVLEFAASADAAGLLAQRLRMDVEELGAWQGMVKGAGNDANAFASSVKSMNDKLYDIATIGDEAGAVFNHLEINIRDAEGRIKYGDKMLLELSGKLQGLSRERAVKLGEKIGLDEYTIDLLRTGRKGIEELLARQKELGVFTKKDAEEARKFNLVFSDMKQAFWSVIAVVGSTLLPVFTSIGEGLTSVAVNVRKHRNLITGFLMALSLIMGVLAIKVAIAFAPFLLLAAVVLLLAAAFAVAYDDIMNFMEGNDSVIGELSKKYPWLGELVRNLVATFQDLWTIVKAVGTLLMEAVESPAQAWENFTGKVGPLFDAFCERFPALGQALKDIGTIFKWLFDLAWPLMKALGEIVVDVLGVIVDGIATVFSWIGKALRWLAEKVSGEIEVITEEPEDKDGPNSQDKPRPSFDDPDYEPALPGELPPDLAADIYRGQFAIEQTNSSVSAAAIGAVAGMNTAGNSTSVQVDKVEVNTQATDAEGISRDIGEALMKEISGAAENYDDGVAA